MMTENPNGGHIVNPNEGDGSTSDPNWHGDAGDQGNDLRFAEEQALIDDQANRADRDPSEAVAAAQQEGHYTSSEPAGEGEYTDRDDR